MPSKIPIMRPKLPAAASLAPYLDAIDSARIYSNFGPLTRSLEERFAARFNLPAANVTTVANATLGLTLVLAALGPKPGTLCAMPAWTYVASAQAAVMAGLIPYFVDVDPETWALDPDGLAEALAQAPAPVGAVMPVVPFGCPIDIGAWDGFRTASGIPVVIDAAAGFDALIAGAVPAVVSLHATKVLGTGEGGFVVSTDAALVRDVQIRTNFGFAGTREAAVLPAGNAKLSEYHAAVGLAALDEWSEARNDWIVVAQTYRDALSQSNRVRFQPGFGQSWIASTCVIGLEGPATRMEALLAHSGIETRRWWGTGAHAHAATRGFPRGALPTTEMLANSTIALPFSRDLHRADIERVAECLIASVSALEAP
jgi:dTDP-4-amino-4,6-dideoxygalactose transaminase